MEFDKYNKIIIFRCALNINSGLGHIIRCIHIAKYLDSSNKVFFIIPESSKKITKTLKKNKLSFKIIPEQLTLSEEFDHYPANIGLVILDLTDAFYKSKPELFYDYLKILSKENINTVVLEGMFEDRILTNDHPAISLIILPYVGADKCISYSKTPVLAGSNYVIIGNEYLNNRSLKCKDKLSRILITLGGSDPQGITLWILDNLKVDLRNRNKYEISVIIGSNFSVSLIKKIKIFKKSLPNLTLIYKPESLLNFFLSTDIALIGSGASSRYEAASCGVPTIGVGINKIHDRQCFLNSGLGGFEYLGFYNDITAQHFCSRVKLLLSDKKNYQNLSNIAYNYIDGLGAYRIARRIQNDFCI